ncbi:demethylmenaquinone methyltransferase [Nocardioides baekrokdamisoli]|uniref:Putative 4-hydroxy-4-methyl-2-oxoglutarate aldolase n=1 Tax=Nocardioides baekrokdamisoli TaxID=1804624 RepID=A0A3G9IGZ3_9ACTN|nr:demethylmenaquinone methyltransferase [Nocardioides baekrokdamisoli]
MLFSTINDRLYTAVIGDVMDTMGYYHQFLPPSIRPLRPEMRVAGRAMPVLVADVYGPQTKPFGLLTEALDDLRPGEVYLARGGAQPAAMWGEILTATAQKRGAVGAVVNGYHRDAAKVLGQGFPVFSAGAYALDSSVRTVVLDFRVPIEVGEVRVTPGDLVVGDIDGVLVVPKSIEAEVIERAMEKASTENVVRAAIERGMSATEAFARHGVL